MHEFIELLGDPAHWAFEITTDLILAGVSFVFGRYLLHRHDRHTHGVEPKADSEPTLVKAGA